MRRLTILWILCAILTASPAFGRDSIRDSRKALRRAPAADGGMLRQSAARQLRTRSGFNWKQRRALGLTIPNMVRTLGEMKRAGELRGLDRKEISEALVGHLRSDNPRAFATEAAIDSEFWARVYSLLKWLLLLLFI